MSSGVFGALAGGADGHKKTVSRAMARNTEFSGQHPSSRVAGQVF
jgi:hypothetical protein